MKNRDPHDSPSNSREDDEVNLRSCMERKKKGCYDLSSNKNNIKFTALNSHSTAYDLTYRRSTLFCNYQDSIFCKNYQIEIECPIERPSFYSKVAGGLVNCATTRIDELSDSLDIGDNGKYLIKNANGLTTLRFGAVLAIGLNADKYKYLASVTTEIGLVYFAVPVMSERAIKVREIMVDVTRKTEP